MEAKEKKRGVKAKPNIETIPFPFPFSVQ